jgi:hypothetical protein
MVMVSVEVPVVVEVVVEVVALELLQQWLAQGCIVVLREHGLVFQEAARDRPLPAQTVLQQ